MRSKGFVPFEKRSEYLYSTTSTENKVETHIGQYRVKFTYAKCGLTSVVAQQIKDNEEHWTFRKWNALKKNVPFGQSTDAEADSTWGSAVFCYACMCVNFIMNTMFEEAILSIKDGIQTAEEYFKGQEEFLHTANYIIRPFGIFLVIMGLYLLFSPVIALMSWIPLVGVLIGQIASFAAFVFAFLVGLTLSCLTIAVAWVFYRPLIGIPLLCLTAAGIYFCFINDPSAKVVSPITVE